MTGAPQLFAAAWDVSPSALATLRPDADGRYAVVVGNRALARLFGRDPSLLPGRTMDELLADRGTSVPRPGETREVLCRVEGGEPAWTRWHMATMPRGAGRGDELFVQIDLVDGPIRDRHRAEQQARLLALIPEPVIVRGLDGTVLYWSDGAAAIYGYPTEVAFGQRTHDLLRTRFVGTTLAELESQLATTGTWQGTLEHRHADGRWLRMTSKHVRDNRDGRTVILEVNVDVTEQYAAEQALAASEAKYRSQFVHSTVGQLIRRLDGTIEEVNDALATLLGYSRAELVGTDGGRLFDEATARTDRSALATLADGSVDAVTTEGTLVRADGAHLEVELDVSAARAADGTVERIIEIVQDMSARKSALEALTHRADHDPLTGLVNRSLLLTRLSEALQTARTSARTVGLMYLDLDGFKEVNDTHGHLAGDALLVQASQRLVHSVRAEDVVARLGGDEFVVLADLDTPARLRQIAERSLASVRQPYQLADGVLVNTVTVSIGIAFPDPGLDPEAALRGADAAMYAAKRAGKNRIRTSVA